MGCTAPLLELQWVDMQGMGAFDPQKRDIGNSDIDRRAMEDKIIRITNMEKSLKMSKQIRHIDYIHNQ